MALLPGDPLSPMISRHHLNDVPYDFTIKPYAAYKVPSHQELPDPFDDGGDDFSDHDSHYSEDEIDFIPPQHCPVIHPPEHLDTHDVSRRLLSFVDKVTADIQRLFGRRRGEEDSCDIYEEKWTSGKSGRELYYADLLKIAQGGDGEKPKKSTKSQSAILTDNRASFSGTRDKKAGLGPLNELFEIGLRSYLIETNARNMRGGAKRLKVDHNKHLESVPMQHRKLPESFWREPFVTNSRPCSPPGLAASIQPSKPPDFSDLLHHWTGGGVEGAGFPNHLSVGDVTGLALLRQTREMCQVDQSV